MALYSFHNLRGKTEPVADSTNSGARLLESKSCKCCVNPLPLCKTRLIVPSEKNYPMS